MTEEKKKEGKDNCPLSPTDWVMFLSGEIHNCSTYFLMIATVIMACVLACLGGAIACLGGAIADLTTRNILFSILVVLGAFAGLMYIIYVNPIWKIIGELDELREDIIAGERDLDKIGRWKKIHEDIISSISYYPKNRHSGLKKSEMNNTNKELEDGKEDLENKDIKETLHRIETKMDEGEEFTFWTVFAGFLIATGLGVIGMSIIHDDNIAPFLGYFMFAGGAFILMACRTNLRSNKKRNLRIAWLVLGFLCIIIGISVLIYTSLVNPSLGAFILVPLIIIFLIILIWAILIILEEIRSCLPEIHFHKK